MKRLFFLVCLVAVAIGVIGFYQGWFVATTTTTLDGKQNVNIVIDKDKIKSDEAKAKEKALELKDKAKDKASDTINKVR